MAHPYLGAPEKTPDIIAAYEHQVSELESLIKGMSGDQLRARPVPGKWSTLELLCHLSDSEQVMAERIKRAAAMDKALVIAYDEDRYVTELAYTHREPAEELHLIRATRAQTTRILKHLRPEQWDRTAVHSERGLFTTKELVQYAVGHLMHHLPFLKEKRRAMGLACD